jgi:integral membrane protein (TIGR00529 family)
LIQAIGFLVSLALIVVLVMRRFNYGLALLIGTVMLGLFSTLSLGQFFEVFRAALTEISTVDLVLIVGLIPLLTYGMKETGMLDRLLNNVKDILPSRAILMFLPALMGALPTPGGALISAPLIDGEAQRLKISSEMKSFINIWFRHWIMFVYPLASPLILASRLTGINLYSLVLIQIIPVALYMLLGYFASLRNITDDSEGEKRRDARTLLSVAESISPILLAIILNILGIDLALALAVAVIFVLVVNKVGPRRAALLVRRGIDWRLPFAVIGVMCFREMTVASGAVSAILPYIEATGLPEIVLVAAISWILGLATGMLFAGLGMAIPIVTAMVGSLSLGLTSHIYLTMVLAYLLSPMHLCLILTIEYYKARLSDVYKKLLPATLAIYLMLVAYALVIQYLLKI